jgi:hypothetical protein
MVSQTKLNLTPWSWVLEKPSVAHLLKNIPTFYGTRRFIVTFTRALYWSLSWPTWILYIPPYPISLRSILTLSSHRHLGFPSGLIHSGIPMSATCHAHLIHKRKRSKLFLWLKWFKVPSSVTSVTVQNVPNQDYSCVLNFVPKERPFQFVLFS